MALQKIPGRAIQLDSQVNSDIMYYIGDEWVRLTKGEAGEILKVNDAGTLPQWGSRLPAYLGSRGLWFSGQSGSGSSNVHVDTIDYVTIATTGNAIDFGDVTVGRIECSSLTGSNGSRGLTGAGIKTEGGVAYTNIIDYITIGTLGNAIDFGDLTFGNNASIRGTCSDGTRGFWCGGQSSGAPEHHYNVIDSVTIATTGNSTDFGDLTVARNCEGMSNDTRGVVYAGGRGIPGLGLSDIIDYFTMASASNAIDFGDATRETSMGGVCQSDTRGIYFGGDTLPPSGNVGIEYITIATTGNALDFGDLTHTARQNSGSSDNTYGVSGAGLDVVGGQYWGDNDIEYVTISTLGNAIDFGDLTITRYAPGSCSGN
jgi:hypothetical protein